MITHDHTTTHIHTHRASHPPWHAYHPSHLHTYTHQASSTHKHLDAHTITPPAHKAQTPAPPFPTTCHANTQPGTQTHTGGVNAATTARHPLLRAHAGALERGERVYLFLSSFSAISRKYRNRLPLFCMDCQVMAQIFGQKNNDLRKNAPNKIYYV